MGGGWLSPAWSQYSLSQMPGMSNLFSGVEFDYFGNPTFSGGRNPYLGGYDYVAPSINPMLLRSVWESPDYA